MPLLRIKPIGNLGNQMLQYVLAASIADRAGPLDIVGHDMPHWGLGAPVPADWGGRSAKLRGHRFGLDPVVRRLRDGRLRRLALAGLGFSLPNYMPAARARALFPPAVDPLERFGDDVLLVNVRGAEILGARHPDYGPLPVAYYRQLVEETGLTPVFLGQIGDDFYGAMLRRAFPRAVFIPSQGARQDFETLRAARVLAVSVSTFSWLAGWLGEASTVHLPVAGLFHPGQRPDVDLLPVDDPRYRFRAFPVRRWSGTPAEVTALEAPGRFDVLTGAEVAGRLARARRARRGADRLADLRLALEMRIFPR